MKKLIIPILLIVAFAVFYPDNELPTTYQEDIQKEIIILSKEDIKEDKYYDKMVKFKRNEVTIYCDNKKRDLETVYKFYKLYEKSFSEEYIDLSKYSAEIVMYILDSEENFNKIIDEFDLNKNEKMYGYCYPVDNEKNIKTIKVVLRGDTSSTFLHEVMHSFLLRLDKNYNNTSIFSHESIAMNFENFTINKYKLNLGIVDYERLRRSMAYNEFKGIVEKTRLKWLLLNIDFDYDVAYAFVFYMKENGIWNKYMESVLQHISMNSNRINDIELIEKAFDKDIKTIESEWKSWINNFDWDEYRRKHRNEYRAVKYKYLKFKPEEWVVN